MGGWGLLSRYQEQKGVKITEWAEMMMYSKSHHQGTSIAGSRRQTSCSLSIKATKSAGFRVVAELLEHLMDLCGGSPVLLCSARRAPRAPLQVWCPPVSLYLPSRQSLSPTPVLPVQQTHAALETTWHSKAVFPTGALAC